MDSKAEVKSPEEDCLITRAHHKSLESILKSSDFQSRVKSFKFTSNFKLSLQLEAVSVVDFTAGAEKEAQTIYKRPRIIFRARKLEGHLMEFLEEQLKKEIPK